MLCIRLFLQAILACSLFILFSTSYAEIRLELPRDTNGIEVLTVLGIGHDKTAYKGVETTTEFTLGPAILTDNFYLDIHSVSYRFRPKEDVLVKVFGEQDELPSEEDIPAGFNIKSGESFDVGFLAEKKFGNFSAGFQLASDVTGTHNGYELDLFGSYNIKKNNISQLGVSSGIRYRDKKKSNYLFGVDESEANSSLNAYTADDEWTPFISAVYSRQLTKNLGFIAAASISSLGKTAKNSPRIKANTNMEEMEIFMGLIWQFSVYKD